MSWRQKRAAVRSHCLKFQAAAARSRLTWSPAKPLRKQRTSRYWCFKLEVIMRRYENRATIMTSNRPLEEWGKLLNDVPTAGAILDRFLHHAQVIAITGKSYRVKEATPTIRENKKPHQIHGSSAAGGAS